MLSGSNSVAQVSPRQGIGFAAAASGVRAGPTRETYDELLFAFNHFNVELFEGKLPSVMITLHRGKRSRGYFSPARFINRERAKVHEIALNPAFFAVVGVEEIMSVLVHQMVHMAELIEGKGSRTTYHNKSWADRMMSIGLCPTDTGQPGGNTVGESVDHYIIKDGKFCKSCARLLASHPGIVWYDRQLAQLPEPVKSQPVAGHTQPPEAADSQPPEPAYFDDDVPAEFGPEGAGLGETPQDLMNAVEANGSAKSKPKEKKPAPPPPPKAEISTKPALETVPGLDMIASGADGNRSLRSKYRCPHQGCGQQAWGKPTLVIDCGTHKVRMEHVGPIPEKKPRQPSTKAVKG